MPCAVHEMIASMVVASSLVGFLLESNDLFNTNSSLDSDRNSVLASIPSLTNLLGHFFGVGWKIQVGLLVSGFVHEGELISVNINDLPVGTVDNGDSGSVGRRNHIFELLSGENVGGSKVTLGVTVLSGLRDGNGKNLARLSLDHHVSECRMKE